MNCLEHTLKSNNLRLTEARKLIYNIISDSEHALSAQEICKIMSENSDIKADPASVYRNLAVFTKAGLTHSLPNGKYVVCQHDLIKECESMHIVASCTDCGKTTELKENTEAYHIASELQNFNFEFTRLATITLEGKCKNCSLI